MRASLHATVSCLSLLLSSLLLLPGVTAISERDAGIHDWAIPLVGQPSTSPGARPRFHYPAGPKDTATSSLVYTITERNVLAAIEPRAGGIVWRHIFPEEKPLLKYELSGDHLLALSGPGASDISLFSASTGHAVWTLQQHKPKQGLLPEPGSLAAGAAFYHYTTDAGPAFDIISLSNGQTARRIDGVSGDVKWIWSLEHDNDPTLQIHAIMPVATDAEAIHLLLIKRLTGSYSLLSLNIPTGGPGQSLREPKVIKGASLEKLESIMTFPPLEGSGSARCVYLDPNGSVKSVSFPAERAQNPLLTTLKGPTFIELRHLDLEGHGLFIGLKADGSSNILQAGHTGDLSALFDWSDAVEAPHFSGFIDRDGAVHVSRYTISKVLWLASMQTWTMQASPHSEAGTVFGSTFAFNPIHHGPILHVASEIAPRTTHSLLFRVCLVTASGSFQSWLGGGLQWSREEGLAHLTVDERSPSVAFLPISWAASSSSDLSIDFTAAGLLRAAQAAVSKPLEVLGLSPRTQVSTRLSRDWLGDAFGYRKLVIVASEYGKIYALDLGNGGKFIWTTYVLPMRSATADRSSPRKLVWKKIAVFDELKDGKVLVMAVAQVETVGGKVTTQVFYLNGLDGHLYHPTISSALLVDGPIVDALVLHGSSDPTLILTTPDQRIHVSTPPEGITSSARVALSTPNLTIADTSGMHEITGRYGLLSAGVNPVHSQTAWTFPLGPTERIIATARQSNGKIASVGRVLGDRSTLYKYINPHLLAIATLDDGKSSAKVYLIDSATGSVIWSANHDHEVETSVAMSVAIAENWLVYAFAEKGSSGRQTRIVSTEIFEKRQKGETFSSFDRAKPYSVSQSFLYPGQITAMSMSQTVHGISSKALLVSTAQDQIISIPRRHLDPRRPQHKPTKDDMEEYLIPYSPVLSIDPKWIVTHKLRVAGVRGILASPTMLESTSQLLAYGLDLFGSSVSPSGRFDVLSRDFNVAQLVATTLALLGATAILKPIVARKQLHERWYPAS